MRGRLWITVDTAGGVCAWLAATRCWAIMASRRGSGECGQIAARAQRLFPAGLERSLEVVAHPVGDMGVQAAHARYLVAEAPLGQNLGNAIFCHPCLMAVPKAVWRQPGLDRQPAGG